MTGLFKNRFKAAIEARELQRGLWVTMQDPLAVEMMAGCGFDWMMLDTEHSPADPLSVLPMLQTLAPYPVSPIVRPTCLDAAQIKKLLDFGAQTILVPYVETVAQAEEAVAAMAYPPEGIRGVSGMTRATRFGTVPGYLARAREELCLIVQVETRATLDVIEDIAAVPGVDAMFVGPADLASSLGHPGEQTHPEVQGAVLDAISRITAAGKPAGILAVNEGLHDAAIEAGAVFASRHLDILVLRQALLAGRQ